MRLKTLEIKGFKSFADKTVINFSEDVIGVVGSNGCGKSNIVDAVRWVLGEQKTSQLRSDSMTNVIFNGTKSRPASGLAEVTLVFENNKGVLAMEYKEVAIKRILYKDGTGEYYLNNIRCRLKDINNLLSDTGMGSDSYAIIALNMVDDLLQDKDNARLELFEQAAGISKYKQRKKESLSKLKATEEDLARVEDLLAEIEKNLQSLEKQAKRTQKYLEIKEEYKTLSLELSYFKIASSKTMYKELDIKLASEKEIVQKLELHIQELETKLQKIKQANLEKEQTLSEAQKNLNKLVGQIKGKENDQKMLSQKSLFIQENNDKLDQRIANAKQRSAELEKDFSNYKSQLTAEQEIAQIIQNELDAAKKAVENTRNNHGSLKQELDVFIRQNTQLQNQVFDMEKKIAVSQSQVEQSQQQLKHLDTQVQQRTLENETIQTQVAQLDEQTKQAEALLHELKTKEETRKQQLETTQNQVDTLREQSAGVNRQLDSKQNEFKLLKSWVESMEGFPESIKFLSKNKDWAANAPLLSDIIYCQPEYRTAIENYLEQYLSYYVVENIEQAILAIQLLDQHQKGKANFFILNQLPVYKLSENTASIGVSALNVVEVDSQYQALIHHLLSNVFVVTDIDNNKHNSELDIVLLTQNGKFTQRAYSLRGGSVGAFEGKKIGRKKNLELLEKQLEELTKEAQTIKNNLVNLQNIQQQLKQTNYQKDIDKQEQNINNLIRQNIGLKGKLENFEAFLQDVARQKQVLTTQIATAQTAQKLLQSDLRSMKEQTEELQETISEKDSSFRYIADELTKASSLYNQKSMDNVRQQNKLSTIQKELEFAQRQLNETKTQLEKDIKTFEDGNLEYNNVQKEGILIEQTLQDWYIEKRELQTELNAAEKQFFEVRGEINSLETEIKQNSKNYQANLQLINQLEQKFNEVKVQLTTIGERLRVEFEIQINDIFNKDPNTELYNEDELDEKVEKLRVKIQNYGAVNYMAVEAYDETKTRFEFITKQKEDLLQAKTILMETLSEIEHKATEKFMDAFAQVRTHFISVFRSLFMEDDTCDLILTDTQNPLDSKIEIIAKPKGKKPLSINQLSGGEKTLTATALLFALYLLKPAPFCVFDEVDAPLDDANIAKFNNIVKDFSKNSQFIIVTHNKKTMESVQIMYGVTMIQGVSRVVPVDFRQLETVGVN